MNITHFCIIKECSSASNIYNITPHTSLDYYKLCTIKECIRAHIYTGYSMSTRISWILFTRSKNTISMKFRKEVILMEPWLLEAKTPNTERSTIRQKALGRDSNITFVFSEGYAKFTCLLFKFEFVRFCDESFKLKLCQISLNGSSCFLPSVWVALVEVAEVVSAVHNAQIINPAVFQDEEG